MAKDFPHGKSISLTNECDEALKKASKIRDKTPSFLMREYIQNGAQADVDQSEALKAPR